MLPLNTTAPRKTVPIVVTAIVCICTGLFVWLLLMPQWQHYVFAKYGLIPLRYSNAAWAMAFGLDPSNYLSLFSMAFLHLNWVHLLANMWALWVFGGPVEARLGILRFVLLYVIAGLLASFAHLLIFPESHVPAIGASGAVAGVFGAFVALYPRARILVLIPLPVRIPAIWFIGFWFAVQVAMGWSTLQEQTSVAWWIHIGGFLAGLVLVTFLAPPRSAPAAGDPAERDSDHDIDRSGGLPSPVSAVTRFGDRRPRWRR